MSGLEKWQMNNPEWREKLLKHLLVKRPLAVLKPTTPMQTDRYSLTVIDDFRELHEARKAKGTDNMNKPLASDQQLTGNCDLTMMLDEARGEEQILNNESFEALEQMCNKTVSDPDSTLFQYLHGDRKEAILEDAKKRSGENLTMQKQKQSNANAFALHRLIHGLKMEDGQLLENESPLKGIECTQLEDIEAPSRLWENTFYNTESLMKTSPVKMVGLLRPSTILESCEESLLSSADGSQMSFETATKSEQHTSDAALTSCYETANDQTASTNNDARPLSVDNLFYAAISKQKPKDPLSMEEIDELLTHDQHNSFNLIDLEATIAAVAADLNATLNTAEDESVIEISSSTDEDTDTDIKDGNKWELNANIKEEKLSIFNPKSGDGNISGMSLLTDQAADTSKDFYCEGIDKENEIAETSLHFNDTMEEVEYMMRKGLEYMAANSAASNATQTSVKNPENKTILDTISPLKKQKTFVISPKKPTGSAANTPKQKPLMINTASNVQLSSEKQKGAVSKRALAGGSLMTKTVASPQRPFKFSPVIKSNASPQRQQFCTTGLAKTKAVASPKHPTSLKKATTNNPSNYYLEMKRLPQREFFKQPTGIPTQLQKEIKQPYSHIVSPIRTYMQKTATTPLISSLNPKSGKMDLLNASVFREAEQRSQTYQPNFFSAGGINSNGKGGSISGIPKGKNLLPSKAYVSSNIKHVVDGRTPVTIPGGQKIHKYLDSAMMPTVLRHDGKVKISGGMHHQADEAHTTTSHIPRPRDQKSLANLSVMSGDISLYTMKDAQKF